MQGPATMKTIGRWFLTLAALAPLPRTAAAIEPWADTALPAREGLSLWLDATRQVRAFAAQGLPPVLPGGPMPAWFDGSGRGRHFVQRSRDAWPRLLVAEGGKAAVRFDGKDDCFAQAGPGLKLERFTAFVVAAPRSNAGGFRGLLAVNQTARRDYETGFTLDLGFAPTGRFESLNVEGKGFGGAVDLLEDAYAFNTFRTLEVRVADGPGGVSLWADGKAQGRRDRLAGTLSADEITVGARFYSNEPIPCYVQGFFDGDIAEVLLYDRPLTDAESEAVRAYLARKHAGLSEAVARSSGTGKPWPSVADPPPVQMLVPGFVVRELPVKLPNINNVKYRPDGKLLALAYNGDILLLSDRDRDGLEEHVETFWENKGRLRAPIGLALTRPDDPHGSGVFVPSKGKVSLIVDTDGDDRADRELVVAEGWKEADHGVDALGVAVGADGAVYFGLGTASYTEAYLLDASGRSHYDLKGERGTILRISPDLRSRSVLATGIRFPVALAFNRRGDLFATDQEGATWLANGNPFDELLHIRQGRHYGFPPRHSRHLPSVIDEPSVYDYRPQHQSTCGLNFDEPVNGGAVFGPGWWSGDALVCGYSRGKIYRTRLAQTSAGYVAENALIAVLNKLTVDACVSPAGALVVATHSGGPDWGSGPDGRGTLYKITYADREHPQPVLAWAASPREVRVAFDRPLEAEHLRGLSQGASIEYGRSVSAGDRFETLRPGYAVVAAQVADPRHDLPVRSARVTTDRRTLLLETDPQSEAVAYAITLPGMGRPPRNRAPRGELPQEPAIDLAYRLTGLQAEWRPSGGDVAWSGWLPHLDLASAQAFTAGSAEHDRLWPLLERPGTLTLRARLDLKDMLRPAVQPGSRVDDTLPPERVSLHLSASGSLEVRSPAGRVALPPGPGDAGDVVIDFGAPPAEPVPIELVLSTASAVAPRLDVLYRTGDDSRPRSLSPGRVILPWARVGSGEASPADQGAIPELAGGNWSRGREVFFGREARCAECHTVRGQGGKIGPDLSNLVHRDYASVLRDLREPSFAINPDYITYTLALADGRVLAGTVRSEGPTLHVGDGQGRETTVDRTEVEAMQPAPISTMPEGLPQGLGPDRLKDLLLFLLTPDLQPAPIRREGAPPPRTRAEVEAVLGPARAAQATPPKPLRIVLAGGPKDHGIDEHDYPLWRTRWAALLGRAEAVTVGTADGWPSADDFASADVLVLYSANPGWSADKGAQLDKFLGRGGGLVLLHYAVNGRSAPDEFARRIGLAWRDGRSRFRHGPLDLTFTAPDHPITAGFKGLHLEDESYWDLVGDPAGIEVLATGVEDGRPRPLLWTRRVGPGRVFASIPGHYTWTFDDPLFRVLLLRAIAWSAGEPTDRFRELVTPGARLAGEDGAGPR
jgi:putative heme-binding domain-containing protein